MRHASREAQCLLFNLLDMYLSSVCFVQWHCKWSALLLSIVSNEIRHLLLSLFQHAGHSFLPLDDVYQANMSAVNEHIGQLKRRHVELICLIQDVVRARSIVRKKKGTFSPSSQLLGTKCRKCQSGERWTTAGNQKCHAHHASETWWATENQTGCIEW